MPIYVLFHELAGLLIYASFTSALSSSSDLCVPSSKPFVCFFIYKYSRYCVLGKLNEMKLNCTLKVYYFLLTMPSSIIRSHNKLNLHVYVSVFGNAR